MKKINVTIMCAGIEGFPRCSDLLESYPVVSVVAQPENLNEEGARLAIRHSDILVLDEAALEQDGLDSLRELLAEQTPAGGLLIADKGNKKKILSAISLGVRGVVARDSLFAELPRARRDIYVGEQAVPGGRADAIGGELG